MGKSALSRTSGSTGSRTLTQRMWAVVAATAVVVVGGLTLAVMLALGPGGGSAAPVAESSGMSAAADGSGPAPGATPVSGSEVQPPEAGLPTQAPERLPAREAATPRVQTPLPASGAAEGSLVSGYPVDLAGPTDGSTVIDSSVSSAGDTLQFSLRARSDAGAYDLRSALGARWSAAGMAGGTADDPAVLSYGDAYSSISVAVEETGTGSVYTVYGVLKAG